MGRSPHSPRDHGVGSSKLKRRQDNPTYLTGILVGLNSYLHDPLHFASYIGSSLTLYSLFILLSVVICVYILLKKLTTNLGDDVGITMAGRVRGKDGCKPGICRLAGSNQRRGCNTMIHLFTTSSPRRHLLHSLYARRRPRRAPSVQLDTQCASFSKWHCSRCQTRDSKDLSR